MAKVTSKILTRLLNSTRTSTLKNNLLKKIILSAKSNIKKEKDSNYKRFKRRKTTSRKNKMLYDTGDLYKSIKRKRNKFSMLKYGLYNQLGTSRGIDKREFVPTSGSKQFNRIINKILKGL